MKVKFYFVLLSLCFSGCVNVSYIRSDIFARHDYVKSIYVMPIAAEVTIDSGFSFTEGELNKRIDHSIEMIKNLSRKSPNGDNSKRFSRRWRKVYTLTIL